MIIENAELKITPYDTPWEAACLLINAEYERINILNQTVIEKFFVLDDLRRIGEHIVNYCNTELKEIEGESGMNEENNLDFDSLDFSKCSIDKKFWALLLLVFSTCKDVDFVKNIKERFGVDLDNTNT